MTNRKFVSSTNHFVVVSLLRFLFSCVSSENARRTNHAVVRNVMVEIQCKPGTAEAWREAFVKEILPSIREAIRKGDAFTNFTLL